MDMKLRKKTHLRDSIIRKSSETSILKKGSIHDTNTDHLSPIKVLNANSTSLSTLSSPLPPSISSKDPTIHYPCSPSANSNTKKFPLSCATSKEMQALISASPTTYLTNPLILSDNLSVFETSQFMAAKRSDSVLVTTIANPHLTMDILPSISSSASRSYNAPLVGIATDKDITFKVIAEGLDPNMVKLSSIMTPDPISIEISSQNCVNLLEQGLKIMIKRQFRHLPVLQTNKSILGILDITHCMMDALKQLEKADRMAKRLKNVLEEESEPQSENSFPSETVDSLLEANKIAEILIDKLSARTIAFLCQSHPKVPPLISYKRNVLDAAKLMKEKGETAVLCVGDASKGGHLCGIFTSKDVVLRVVAAGLDPATTSLVRVMTPHPDSISLNTSLLEALTKMYTGHYLHLPVLDDNQLPFALVDVLRLTYHTLDQINSFQRRDADSGSFFDQILLLGNAQGSNSIAERTSLSYQDSYNEAYDGKSEINHSDLSFSEGFDALSNEPTHPNLNNVSPTKKYIYKIKGPNGAIYLGFQDINYEELVQVIYGKFNLPEDLSLRLCYRDMDDDLVLVSNSEDLMIAFQPHQHNLKSASQGRIHLLVFIGAVSLKEWSSRNISSSQDGNEELSIESNTKTEDINTGFMSPPMTDIEINQKEKANLPNDEQKNYLNRFQLNLERSSKSPQRWRLRPNTSFIIMSLGIFAGAYVIIRKMTQ